MSAKNKRGNKSWRKKLKSVSSQSSVAWERTLGFGIQILNPAKQTLKSVLNLAKSLSSNWRNPWMFSNIFCWTIFPLNIWMRFKSLWAKLTEATLTFDSSFFINRNILQFSVKKKMCAQDAGISMFPLQLPNLMELLSESFFSSVLLRVPHPVQWKHWRHGGNAARKVIKKWGKLSKNVESYKKNTIYMFFNYG